MIKEKKYELAFISRVEDCSSILSELHNEHYSILEEGPVKKVKLAYPIKKEEFAYFGYLRFEGEGKGIANLKKKLARNLNILRFLIICL